jgi:hypothetical protein
LIDRHKLDALIESFANAPSSSLVMNANNEKGENA